MDDLTRPPEGAPDAAGNGGRPRGNPDIARHAVEGGKASGERRRRLTLERIGAELPPLDSLEHAMERLDTVGRWALAGMVPGAIASAVVRSVEVWIRGHEATMTREVVDQLRGRLDELEAQLARPRLGVGR